MSEEPRQRRSIELKARYDDREKALRVLSRLGAEFLSTERQTDSYFSVGSYRMKLRESSLGNHWLIGYSRPNEAGSRPSNCRLEAVPDPAEKKRILSRAMGVKAVVVKERTLYRLGFVRVHIDRVEDLGDFLEFEAVLEEGTDDAGAHARLEELRREFEIFEEDLIAGSYADLARLESPT